MLPLPIDFKLCHYDIAGTLQEFRNRCFKREHVESNALNHWKLNTFVLLSLRFLKKQWDIVIPSIHQHFSVHLSVMLSPPKLLDEIQPNLVCELLL